VKDINSQITSIAQKEQSHRLRSERPFAGYAPAAFLPGHKASPPTIWADSISLDGYYPGETGNALIANEVLNLINTTYGTSYLPISLASIAATDPTVRFAVQVEGSIR